MEIYPSYAMVFLIFNLLGWWYKGQPFFSWWWFVPIIALEIIIKSLLLSIVSKIANIKNRN